MKYVSRVGIALVIAGALVAGNAAYAQTASTTATSSIASHVSINKHGKATITGTVQTVGTKGFTLSTQSGIWTIKASSTTKFNHKLKLADVKVGDRVMVHGTVAAGQSMTVNAQKIEDKTAKDLQNKNKKDAKKTKKELHKATTTLDRVGTVQAVASSSLTVQTKKGTTTVNTDANTRVYTASWFPSSLANILVGHKIETFGPSTGTTSMNAVLIHNLSL